MRLLLPIAARLPLMLCAAAALFAQEPRRETVVVTGTWAPLALDEVDRAVTTFPVRDQALLSTAPADFFRLDPSLDLQQRAPGGVQADLSIRGAAFGQTLVLVDGARMNDAQTGHHNLDIPVPLESAIAVEVLRGAGSTLYGSDAVGGVVNVITRAPEVSELRLRVAAGSFGFQEQRGSLTLREGSASEQLVFSRDFSSGFRPDRDYRNLSLASRTHFAGTDLTLAWQDRPFGADQFYGDFNSWERTRTWFGSLRQRLGLHTTASLSYRRHTDLFVLYRDRPWLYTNRHAVESWNFALRRSSAVFGGANLHYGVEGYRDAISSGNLGNHARGRGAAYAALDWRVLRRFSFTLGAREEIYRAVSGQFTPSASGGFWIDAHLKLRASASRAFRIPSYTELYYHDPANLGNPALRPERASSYEAGLDWNPSRRLHGEATVFHRRERDGIDYVRTDPADVWRAANIQRLDFTGVETGLRLALGGGQADLRYTALEGVQESLRGLLTKYGFNYPTHAATAGWTGRLPGSLLLRTRLGATVRAASSPYAVWDLYAASTRGRLHPFAHFTNITATRYQEVPGVDMPGRAISGGLELVIGRR